MNDFKVEMEDISIQFPGVKALQRAKFNICQGEVQALIGANGAGKSTLMKVLSGAYSDWTGKIRINGILKDIRDIKKAKDLGIEIVYQEVDSALFPNLTVVENILIEEFCMDMGKKQFINWSKMKIKAVEYLSLINFDIDINQTVENLTLAEKQMIVIARAVSRKCKLLILDEPTAPLSKSETDQLFRKVNDLKQKKVAVVFITHKLPEVFDICETITIMKDGKFILKDKISNLTLDSVVENMLGRKIEDNFPSKRTNPGEICLAVEKINDGKILKNVSINVRKGEIIGIAGLVGAGKSELCKAIFGADQILKGTIYMNTNELRIKNPNNAVVSGLALVPENRRTEGLLIEEPIFKNLTLTSLEKFSILSFLNFNKEKKAVSKKINELNIKTPSEKQKVAFLSGGNQQKVAVGKWLILDAQVYIFDEPTKGIDVGAKKEIYELIMTLASQGKSIIYATCETQEILGLCDRAYIMYGGNISKEVFPHESSEEEILYYSVGGNS